MEKPIQQGKKELQGTDGINKKVIFIISVFFILIFFSLLLILASYISYHLGKNSNKDATSTCITTTTTSVSSTAPSTQVSIPDGWKTYSAETEFIYLSAVIPDDMSGKISELYITLSSADKLITLYVAGECEGCTVVAEGTNYEETYTVETNNLMMNNETCTRKAYKANTTGLYDLYEASCLGDEEVHIWGTCNGSKTQLDLCDQISEKMVVENL